MAKPKIFISHISTEAEMAQILKKHIDEDFLSVPNIYVSSDGETIEAGSKWLNGLSKALEESQIEIVLCSNESVGRPWVNFEAGAGWVRGIPVIPVCHSGMTENDLPIPLSMLQAVQANQKDDLKKLYKAIATRLEMRTPNADFKNIAKEIVEQENKYIKAMHALESIENPRVLCAASEQFAKLDIGFDFDVNVLEKYFPKRVMVKRNLNSKGLIELLTTHRFDIVHLVLKINQDNGDLEFNPIDSDSPKSDDRMSPQSFANLLIESQTKLVVLATCRAFYLATKVSSVTNIIAPNTEIYGNDLAEWAECFYDLLAKGKSLFKSFDITRNQYTNTKMELMPQKDVIFALKTVTQKEIT